MIIKNISKIIAERPRAVILIFILLTILIASQATNLYMESDFTSYLPQKDPSLSLLNDIYEEFNLGQTIIIFINQTDKYPDDVRDIRVLTEMDQVYETLYEIPSKYGKQTDIMAINCLSLYLREENNKQPPLGNGKFELPETQGEIYDYLQRTEVQMVKDVLCTDDYRYTVMIIQLELDANVEKVLTRTKEAVNNRGTFFANMTITGTLPIQRAVQQKSMSNLLIIFPIALLLIAFVIFFFHRSLKAIIIAFLPTATAIAMTFGTLGIYAPELTIISVAIVALLTGLGVDYSIHLMNRLADEKYLKDDKLRVEKILKSTGKAVMLSTITTVIGFGSLMISSMDPMVNFGFGCAIGILFSFVSAIVLVPCLVIILKFEKTAKVPTWSKLANFSMNNSKRVILIAAFLAIMSVVVLPQVKTDINFYDFYPEGVDEVDAMYDYSDKFGGGGNFNAFLVETDPYGLEDPLVIESIYEMENVMRAQGVTVSSIADYLKDINDILDVNIITRTFENLTNLDNLIFDMISETGIVNEDHSKTLVTIQIPVGKSIQEIEEIVNNLNQIAEDTIIPRGGLVSELTGQDALTVKVSNNLFDEQSQSMILALLLVLAVLILIFNSTLYGVLTLIPVIFVLMWEPGFLVASSVPLSPVTITIASIMIGIGIDYGVHITHRVREELAKGIEKKQAINSAIGTTGLSLIEASLTTIAGMGSIYFVGIPALREFVTVIIFMVSVSVVAATLLLPVFFELKIVK